MWLKLLNTFDYCLTKPERQRVVVAVDKVVTELADNVGSARG